MDRTAEASASAVLCHQCLTEAGRSAQHDHCYLLYDKPAALTYDARRWLEAIIEIGEELGVGFRIAMRDLEIRGAGELPGAPARSHRQRGFRPLHPAAGSSDAQEIMAVG